MKVFPDTNVLVSAFISRGLSSEIFRIILKEHRLFIGDIVLEELQSILLDKFKMPDDQVGSIIDFLKSFEIFQYSGEASPIKLRDKDDEKVLAVAIKSNADVLITGDKDLLDVREDVEIKILNPKEFLILIKSG